MTWRQALGEHCELARIPLAKLTTMAIGGEADVVTVTEASDLPRLLAAGEWHFLGKGANLLVHDAPLEQPVLRLHRRLSQRQWLQQDDRQGILRVGGAHDLARLIGICARDGWGGLEGLAGVPASIGGALCMNAGTASAWIFDCVERVQVLLPNDSQLRWFSRAELNPVYRDSGLPRGTFFINCELRLHKDDPRRLLHTASTLKRAKAASQPLAAASAGCIFKNPRPDLPAGKLIDELGLKGCRVGGAQISQQHGNFIINTGGAQAREVAALIRHIRYHAQQQRGIDLSLEVQRWEIPESWFIATAEDGHLSEQGASHDQR